MTEAMWVAIIAGGFGFAGSALSIFFGLERVKKAISCLAEGLSIGLDNDRVIFKAFRKHAINGESEAQEKKMDEYFRKQTKKGFSAND
jgi:hypothetical protein